MLTIHLLTSQSPPNRQGEHRQFFSTQDVQLEVDPIVASDALTFADYIERGVVVERYRHFTPEALGLALTHKTVWEKCSAGDKPVVVLRCNTIVRFDFVSACESLMQRAPAKWDVIMLTYNIDSVVDVEAVADKQMRCTFRQLRPMDVSEFASDERAPVMLPLNNSFGIAAYALSPNGARQLLQLCFPMAGLAVGVPAMERILSPTNSLDAIMNAHYRKLNAYCILPPLALRVS